MPQSDEECCPKFNPSTWDKKEIIWKDKLFIMDTVPQFLHIPVFGQYGKVVTKMFNQIEKAGAQVPKEETLLLAYDPSPWKSELYINIAKKVPGANNVTLSGTYLTRVFDGPYNAVPKWLTEMDEYIKSKKKIAKKYYIFYTTCPKCAKKWGHNYSVVFGEV